MNLNRILCTASFVLLFSAMGAAQSVDDTDLGLDYDINDIVMEWDDWFTNPDDENAFIAEFMEDYDVPQSGMQNLNRKETWYWWASHNADAVEDYIERREENE